jgi:hypothetical protein
VSPLTPRVLLSGHAKLPQDTAVRADYDVLAVIVVVEERHGVIIDVDVTSLSAPARDFVKDALIGISLSDPMDRVVEYLSASYRGNAKRSILAAITDIYKQWNKLREDGGDDR